MFQWFKKINPNLNRNLPYPQEEVKKCNLSPNDQTLDSKNSNQQKCLAPKFSFIPLRGINPIWTHHFIPFENDSSTCGQEEEIKWCVDHESKEDMYIFIYIYILMLRGVRIYCCLVGRWRSAKHKTIWKVISVERLCCCSSTRWRPLQIHELHILLLWSDVKTFCCLPADLRCSYGSYTTTTHYSHAYTKYKYRHYCPQEQQLLLPHHASHVYLEPEHQILFFQCYGPLLSSLVMDFSSLLLLWTSLLFSSLLFSSFTSSRPSDEPRLFTHNQISFWLIFLASMDLNHLKCYGKCLFFFKICEVDA